MDIVYALCCSLLLFAALFLHIFSLPANWIISALLAAWAAIFPDGGVTWHFVGAMFGLSLLGELLEFVSQSWGARKYGASARGNLGGIIGAIAGAILGAPFLLGVGALIGALGGAYAGCLIFELSHGKAMPEARRAATGAFWGKAFGLTAKLALGAAMLVMSLPRVWG